MTEPLAAVCNGLCDPSLIEPGDRVLTIGPGPIGALATQVVRASGGDATVIGMPTDRMRLDTISEFGFDTATVDELPDLADTSRRFDVSVDCAGVSASGALALRPPRKSDASSDWGSAEPTSQCH